MKKIIAILIVTLLIPTFVVKAEEITDLCQGEAGNCAFCVYSVQESNPGCNIKFSVTYKENESDISYKEYSTSSTSSEISCFLDFNNFEDSDFMDLSGNLVCPSIGYTASDLERGAAIFRYLEINTSGDINPLSESKITQIEETTSIYPTRLSYANICDNSGVGNAMAIIGYIVLLAKWIAPLIIIVLGMLDFGKVVVSDDEKAMGKAAGSLIKRVIAGLVIFLVPTLVSYFTKSILKSDIENSFVGCTSCLFNPSECRERIKSQTP